MNVTKRWLFRLAATMAVAASGAGCSDAHKTDTGGVQIGFGDIAWSAVYSVSSSLAQGGATIESVVLRSVVIGGDSGVLQTIQIETIEVTYQRVDTGTRVPTPLVRQFPGTIEPNGTLTINEMFILFPSQLGVPPLSDLADFGRDLETNSQTIVLNISVRFFGRTLGGRDVVSEPLRKTVSFQP